MSLEETMKTNSIVGFIIVHPNGTVETDYFQAQAFTDRGQVVTREEWRRRYRPYCRIVEATLWWKTT